MKIAAVTDDGQTISPHFGRAIRYAVFTIEDGHIVAQELREKANHFDFHQGDDAGHLASHPIQPAGHKHDPGHGHGRHSAYKHQRMFESIPDCQIVLSRGMGQGAYIGLQALGIQPLLTDIRDIADAVQAVIDGSIVDHPERLH